MNKHDGGGGERVAAGAVQKGDVTREGGALGHEFGHRGQRPDGDAEGLSLLKDISRTAWSDWRWQMGNRLWTKEDLGSLGGPNSERNREAEGTATLLDRYPWAITPYLFSLFGRSNEEDPLRKQFVPDLRELEETRWLSDDPLGETTHSPVPDLIQRYPDRALVVFGSRCASYCRYCFRKRHWRGERVALSESRQKEILRYLTRSPAIREVIISGGDPLVTEDDLLLAFLGRLRGIRHIEVLRIATRVPSVLPMRVTTTLADGLAALRPLWITVQVNHPAEITEEMTRACEMFLRRGIPVLSQSVLLRGVNDRTETLKALFTGLERIMVKPYYLHQADPVEGTEHFRTSVHTGISIMESLGCAIAGPALPRFVVDCAGTGGKVPVRPPYLASNPAGAWVEFRDPRGGTFRYPNPGEG